MKKLISIFAAVLVTAGCIGSVVAKSNMSGTLSMSGAWAIYPLAIQWGDAFTKTNPDVKMNISAGGAGKGMTDVLSGAVDIGMVSREVDKSEKAKGALPIFVAKDGVFATISTKNPALKQIMSKGLTKEQFIGIFIDGTVTNWKQVGGPNVPIHAYTRSDSCGAASAWASALGKYKQENLKGIGVYGDPGVVDAVRKDPLGIGYNNLGFVFAGETVARGIALVPIDANKNGKADAGEKITNRTKAYTEISSGRYPGSRREYFVTKGKPGPLAKAYIEFALSDAGVRVLEKVGGFVPLSKAERAAQLKNLR
jgi:phosphate transport system substrate-binding protein